MKLKKTGGLFDLMGKWFQERSSLNHDILSNNYFRWALTPGRSDYAETAIKGMNKKFHRPIFGFRRQTRAILNDTSDLVFYAINLFTKCIYLRFQPVDPLFK